MIAKVFLLVIVLFLSVTDAHSNVEGYDNATFITQTFNAILSAGGSITKACTGITVPGFESSVPVNLIQFNCYTMTGTVEVLSPWLYGTRLYVKVVNRKPVAAIYVTGNGIRHNIEIEEKNWKMFSELGNNRFGYDFKNDRFFEVNFPDFFALANQIKRIEITPSELVDVINEYYRLKEKVGLWTGKLQSVDKFIYSLLTDEKEKKRLLRSMVVRKFYDFSKIDSQYSVWIFDFMFNDFCELNKCLDTAFVSKFVYEDIPVQIERDIQRKTEKITVGRDMIQYRLDEKGVEVIQATFALPELIQEQIKKFSTTRNLTDQIIHYLKKRIHAGVTR